MGGAVSAAPPRVRGGVVDVRLTVGGIVAGEASLSAGNDGEVAAEAAELEPALEVDLTVAPGDGLVRQAVEM